MNEEEKVLHQESKFYQAYQTGRSWVIASLGVIITIVAIVLIFFISSLEGTSEIKAGNYKSGKILNVWREREGITAENVFPAVKSTIVEYDGREYYYIEENDPETGEVTDWYFAFEGGLQYVFNDYKYYVLTAIVALIAIFVSYINYSSSVNSSKNTAKFTNSLIYYKDAKGKVRGFFHLIPLFCIDKNKERTDIAVRDIVEEAGLLYEDYIGGKVEKDKLEKWQKKILKKIEKIKITRLHSTDLLQEKTKGGKAIRMLPIGENENQRNFIISSSFQKVISIALSGVVVAFGVVLGNWTLGATYGFTVAMGAVTAGIAGSDYAYNVLRNRFITKADYLIEFFDVKEKYIEKVITPVLEDKPNQEEDKPKLLEDKPNQEEDKPKLLEEGEPNGIKEIKRY